MNSWLERARAKVAETAEHLQQAMRRDLERHGHPDRVLAIDLAGKVAIERPRRIKPPTALQRHPTMRQTQDPLVGFRAAVERANTGGGLDVAKTQLAMALKYQMRGTGLRHHAAAILQARQQVTSAEQQVKSAAV